MQKGGGRGCERRISRKYLKKRIKVIQIYGNQFPADRTNGKQHCPTARSHQPDRSELPVMTGVRLLCR